MKKMLLAIALAIPIISNAMDAPKEDYIFLPITISIQVPKPVDISEATSVVDASEIIRCLKDASDVNSIPLKFYDGILKLGSEKPLSEEFYKALLFAWGIQDISVILCPEETIPVLVDRICSTVSEVKKSILK